MWRAITVVALDEQAGLCMYAVCKVLRCISFLRYNRLRFKPWNLHEKAGRMILLRAIPIKPFKKKDNKDKIKKKTSADMFILRSIFPKLTGSSLLVSMDSLLTSFKVIG